MTGAGGKEVGRVSIRVVPNLDEFREKLGAELEKWEKKTVDIQARLKDSGKKLNNELQQATKESKVAVDAKTGNTEKLTKGIEKAAKGAKTDIELDLDRFARRYRNKFQALMSEFEANLPLTVDNEVIREGLIDAEKEFNEKLRLLDPKKDQETLAKLRQEVEDFYRQARDFGYGDNLLSKELRSQVKIQFDVANAKRDIAEIKQKVDDDFAEFRRLEFFNRLGQERLELLLRPKIELSELNKFSRRVVVPVRIQAAFDKGGFTRAAAVGIAGALKVAGKAANGFFDGLGKLQKLTSRFSAESVITGMAIVAAVAALAAPAIALLSGALLTLPAALAGILVPIGAVALGMDGIKKAAETAKPAFEELKKAVSDTFENGLKPGFELVRDRLLPGLTEPLKGVASSLSTAFNSVIGTLSSPTGLNNLQRTIDNIGAAIRAAVPGLQSFTSGLTSLVANVTAKFPNLSESFNNVGKDFDNWIAKITSNGQLDTALDTLGGTLSEIGGTIKDIAQWGFDNLADPVFGAQLKGFAEDLRALVNGTLPLLKSGFQDVAAVVSGIRDTFNQIGNLSKSFADITGLKRDLDTSAKQTEGAFGLFGKDGVLGDKAPFRKFLGEAQAAKREALLAGQGVGQELSKGVQQSLTAAGGADIGPAVAKQINQAISVSAEDQKQALKSAFTAGGVDSSVSQQLTQQITAAIQGAKNAMANLGPELQTQIDNALLPLATIADRVGQAFSTMGPAINNAFIAAMAGVRNTITGLFAFMVLAIGTQTSKISNSIGEAFQGAPQQVGAALAGVPGAVAGALAPAIAAAANAAVGMLQAMNAGLAALPAVVQAWFGAVPATVQGAMSPAIGTVASVCQQIVSTMLSFAGAAEQAGTAIGASFAKGIASATNLVISSASALMNAARAFFPASPAEKGPFSGSGWVDNSGKAVGEGFAAGMQSSVGGVVDIARVMMQQVKDVFGNAEGLVINFNFNQVAQPISQFSNSIAGIGTSMAGALPAAQEFQQTLGQTGQSLAMLDSSQSKGRIEELKKSLLELEIQRKQLEAARDMPGADQAAIKAQIEQIRNQKNLLGLERDKLTYAQKYGGQMSSTAQSYKEQMNSLQQIPFDFATATSSQFMSDLGWSGQGAIPSLMQQGMDFGTNFIFNVANMDDALSGQRVLQNRTAQATLGR